MTVYNYAGVNSICLIGKETVFGTPVTADKNVGLIQSVDLNEANAYERVHGLGARDAQALVPKVFELSGTIDAVYQVGRLIAYAVGEDTISGAGDPYTHTIDDTATGSVSSFTMQLAHDAATDVVQTVAGCVVNSLKISGDVGSPLKLSADLMGKTVGLATTGKGTYTPDTTQVPAPQYGSVKIGAAGSEEVILQVQNFDLTINNNFDLVPALGQRLKQAAVPKTRTWDMSMSTYMTYDSGATTKDAYELLQIALGGTSPQDTITEQSVIVSFNNGVGGGAGTRSVTFNLSGVAPESVKVSAPVDGIVSVDFNVIAKSYNSSSKIVCVDDIATAYL
jgi:hypothetical protein